MPVETQGGRVVLELAADRLEERVRELLYGLARVQVRAGQQLFAERQTGSPR